MTMFPMASAAAAAFYARHAVSEVYVCSEERVECVCQCVEWIRVCFLCVSSVRIQVYARVGAVCD